MRLSIQGQGCDRRYIRQSLALVAPTVRLWSGPFQAWPGQPGLATTSGVSRWLRQYPALPGSNHRPFRVDPASARPVLAGKDTLASMSVYQIAESWLSKHWSLL